MANSGVLNPKKVKKTHITGWWLNGKSKQTVSLTQRWGSSRVFQGASGRALEEPGPNPAHPSFFIPLYSLSSPVCAALRKSCWIVWTGAA
jgi:hypothetical protein